MYKIIKKIIIKPQYLNENLIDKIKEETAIQLENYCSKEYGYLTEITDINIPTNNFLVSNIDSSIIAKIEVMINTIKPEKDEEFIGKIILINSIGIFIEILPYFKVLISKATLTKDYYYNDVNRTYEHRFFEQKTLTVDLSVKVRITMTKFCKNRFESFGILA